MIATIMINGTDYTWVLYVLAAFSLGMDAGYVLGILDFRRNVA